MKEKIQLQVFLVFLFIVCAMALSQASFAAITMTPTVEGYSAGMFRPAVTPTVTNGAFDAVGKLFINGNTVTLPASLAPASNAASYAKNTLWSNPWLTGLALLAWPASLSIGQDATPGSWSVTTAGTTGGTYSGYGLGARGCGNGDVCASTREQVCSTVGGSYNSITWDCYVAYDTCVSLGYTGCNVGSTTQLYVGSRTWTVASTPSTSRPATLDDFLALPDPPIDALGDMAPQVGVPVSPPFYLASDVPIGSPYTKPDGSTAQPRAKISPATNGQVTVATYDQPLTDASGNPVTNPAPQPTPDPVQDQCQKYPDSVGCATLGTDSFAVPTSSVPLSFTPEAAPFSGTCPAPISVLGQSISFQSSCDAMTMIRPLVLAFAAVMAAFILLDTFRGAA